ncbi:MAG: nucleotidyltransferase family protein [Balneolia bacterium]|nr:nucleotidyltransferase family protein [Balneolia bacterium]
MSNKNDSEDIERQGAMRTLTTDEVVKILTGLKAELKQRFGVTRIGFFGSFARNEPDRDSDVDILVELEEPLGWEFFEMLELLEEKLGKPVDLTTNTALKKQLRDSILKEVRYV